MDGVSSPSFQCREIWGSNRKNEQDFQFGSLKGFLLSIPYKSSQGGDIHFLSFCEQEALSKIVLADVSGHGDIVARVAAKIRGILSEYINEMDNRRLLESVNHELRGMLHNGKFVTMVAATYHAPSRSFIYAYAGHPALFRYKASQERWDLLKTSDDPGVPLGIIGETDYVQVKTILSPGDMLLFYTDGLLSIQRNSNPQLSVEELLALCQQITSSHPEPRKIVTSLLNRVKESSEAGFTDDVTLIALEVVE